MSNGLLGILIALCINQVRFGISQCFVCGFFFFCVGVFFFLKHLVPYYLSARHHGSLSVTPMEMVAMCLLMEECSQ